MFLACFYILGIFGHFSASCSYKKVLIKKIRRHYIGTPINTQVPPYIWLLFKIFACKISKGNCFLEFLNCLCSQKITLCWRARKDSQTTFATAGTSLNFSIHFKTSFKFLSLPTTSRVQLETVAKRSPKRSASEIVFATTYYALGV